MSYQYFPRPHGNQMPSNISMNATPQSPSISVIPAGTTVLANYGEFTWFYGVVQGYNLLRNGGLLYQIMFRSGEIKTIASPQVLNQQSNNQNIEVGTRIVVKHPTKTMFVTSLVAELPCSENFFRYMLFLDDGTACYKTRDKLWVIDLVENPILSLPPHYKAFIHSFFISTGTGLHLYDVNVNDNIVFTSNDNVNAQFTGKISEVDCNIALVTFDASNCSSSQEWIFRGSTRIISVHPNSNLVPMNNNNDNHNQPLEKHAFNSLPNTLSVFTNNTSDNSAVLHSDQLGMKPFRKSPLKSKQFMATPSFDPFSFTGDTELNHSKAWGTTRNQFSNSTDPNAGDYSAFVSSSSAPQLPSTSPIIVVDDSPIKVASPSPVHEARPLEPSSVFTTADKNFCSPPSRHTAVGTPEKQPSSVFSWSPPVEFESKRKLEFSPKHKTEFDFGDTILGSPPPTSQTTDPLLGKWPGSEEVHDDVIVIDDNTSPPPPPPLKGPERLCHRTSPTNIPHTPVKVEPKVEVIYVNDHTPTKIKAEPKIEISSEGEGDKMALVMDANLSPKEPTAITGSVLPVILHQETCDLDPALYVDENGSSSTIEVVVGQSNGETIISVGASSLEIKPNGAEFQLNGISSSPGKSRKRRMLSPKKSPVAPIPKLKINLKTIADSSSVSRDLAAQKCVKRARKQQSKEIKKQCLSQFIKKKNKLKGDNSNGGNVELNPDIELSEWTSPWCSRIQCKAHPNQATQNSEELFMQLLDKVDYAKVEEELEEGELESDSENDDEDALSSGGGTNLPGHRNHTCTLLCNNFNPQKPENYSPLAYPIANQWNRRIKLTGRKSTVTYVTPCSKSLTSMKAVETFLKESKCSYLRKSNFCFDGTISLDVSDIILDFDPLFSDNDLSNGLEGISIPFVSNIGPIIKYNFQYVIDSILDFKPPSIDAMTTFCECTDDCSSLCPCNREIEGCTVECNNNCSCSLTCAHRRSQQRLKQKLKIIQRDTKFHVHTLHDIPASTTLCSLTGIIRRYPVPPQTDFIYPLHHNTYLEAEQNPGGRQPPKEAKKRDIPTFRHSTNLLNLDEGTELRSKRYVIRYQPPSNGINPIWSLHSVKHGNRSVYTKPEVRTDFPAAVIGCSNIYANQPSSSQSSDYPTVQPASWEPEYYLDCTDIGNVGRFVRIGPNFNATIEPVFVDSQVIPTLIISTLKTVLAQSEIILKPFNR